MAHDRSDVSKNRTKLVPLPEASIDGCRQSVENREQAPLKGLR
jgi:hypothetical protein